MADDQWIRRYHPAPGHDVQLVCLPHAGGSASFFFPVSAALHSRAEVLAVQYPGRQDRRAEKPIDDIETLADRVRDALRPWLTRPTVLFGHSMGAIVAYEVARRLERDGTVPARLVVSGRRAPSRARPERVHLLDDARLVAELGRLGGTETAMLGDEELRRMILPAVRSDYRAIETYEWAPGPPLRCPVTAFAGDRDPQTSPDEIAAWREYTAGGFASEVFAGGHFFLAERPEEVIARLGALLPVTTAGV
jgi:surfactin synthase thioesterase subunit